MLKRIVAICVFVCMVFLHIAPLQASITYAADFSVSTDIRVGLQALYVKKSSLTIENTQIGLGYCVDGTYRIEETLTGQNGFVVTPDTQYYYQSKELYATKKLAKQAAEKVKKTGATAMLVTISRNMWSVYACGAESKDKAEQLIKKYGTEEKEALSIGGVLFLAEAEQSGYTIRIVGDETILADATEKLVYPQFSALTADSAGAYIISLGARSYRGRLEIGRYRKSAYISAVNVVPLEDYLCGVVPCEMSASHNTEALKAQAVCARSYALLKTGYGGETNLSRGFLLCDTTDDQVYGGYGFEKQQTNLAVAATKGQRVYYDGKPVQVYYFSTSGGRTEDAEDVWGKEVAHLRGVVDRYETNPSVTPWMITKTKEELAEELREIGIRVGEITDMIEEIKTISGRVYSLRVKGTERSYTMQGTAFRDVLKLNSTKFKVIAYGDEPDAVYMLGSAGIEQQRIQDCYVINGSYQVNKASTELAQYVVRSADNLTNFPNQAPASDTIFYFAGMGAGHGIGMSQSGANGMAKAGYNYKEIIAYYFTDTQVK